MRVVRISTVVAVFALACAPARAAAQEPVKSFDQLNTRLKVGDTIWVTDAQGREIKGRLTSLPAGALGVEAGGARSFAAPDVHLIKIRGRDSLKNGTLIGLAAGGGMAALWCAAMIDLEGGAKEGSPGVECAEGLIVFGGLGTVIGLGIDALMPGKPVVVYRAPGQAETRHSRLSIVPVITPRTKGAAVSFAF